MNKRTNDKDEKYQNQTALDYAKEKNNPKILSLLGIKTLFHYNFHLELSNSLGKWSNDYSNLSNMNALSQLPKDEKKVHSFSLMKTFLIFFY